MTTSSESVLILGCGFAGVWTSQAVRNAPVAVTVLARPNARPVAPLLSEVATAGLPAPPRAPPIRHILAAQRNATVLLGEARRIVVDGRRVVLEDGTSLPY